MAEAEPLPERLDRFMARANAIYYASRDPFADFTTSPEISQVFGEIIGLWAAVTWQLLGSPAPVLLAEAGPGRGTLMADALRAIQRAAPTFAAALRVHLIETSPRLRAVQAARIPGTTWHDEIGTLPAAPLILLANEFLDALPIRQFVRRGEGWTERFVVGGEWTEQPASPGDVPPNRAAGEGDIVELNEPSRGFVAAVAARLCRHPGAALFLDYGPARSAAGDSLQALADKRPVNPLTVAGSADLTAHVDFADLGAIAKAHGAAVQGPETQGAFLSALGLFQRTERLARSQPEKASALMQATRRLADPEAMGELFKVLALRSPAAPALPGLAGC
ncbi:MAG TPA: methyltransferase [Acetobacteraceae bacterium]|jgi:NADH dehydrogenase [ubiquinone] 1 alpha subcomplex assembly factor 7|nr:methyltransferase [Acetobacteraceae bacterium]